MTAPTAPTTVRSANGAPGDEGRSPPQGPRRRPQAWSSSLAATLYLALGVALWWHVWSASPSGVMTCDCTDAGRMVWYLAWTPFALGHGHSLLFSTYQFHPGGFNLLADTSVPALGVVLSPVTALFGPVVSMNLVSTLIPAATAFAMYRLLLRWVAWAPAAFVGGLAYGFSAWVVVQLAFGWINLACLALLPLMAACLDELLVRQRRPAAAAGAAFALLLAVEFFVSIEMALLVAVSTLAAVVLVVVGTWCTRRDELRRRARRAAVGLGTAGALSAVLLAYPVWFFAAGPAHLSGSVWTTNVPGTLGNTPGNLWDPIGHWGSISASYLAAEAHALGGFAGTAGPSPSYLGWGLLAVVAVGLLLWRSDRRLWFFGALGAVTFLLSLEAGPRHWSPWSLFDRLPVLLDVVQYRFAGIFVLCATAMLAVTLDRSHTAVAARLADRTAGAGGGGAPVDRRRATTARVAAAGVALALSAIALGPEVHALAPNLPVPMRPVTVPRWFSTAAPRLGSGVVLATYPFPTADSQSPIPWQAIAGLPYQMAGGGGPAGTVARAGRQREGYRALRAASMPTVGPPRLDRSTLTAVRSALRAWKVTMVVVPDTTGLPGFQRGRGTAYGVAFYTAVLGAAPVRQDGAWLWRKVEDTAATPVPVTSGTLATCLVPRPGPARISDPWAACILGHRGAPAGRP